MEQISNPMPVSIVRTSPDCGALVEALAAAQGEFPVIEKNQTGKVHGEKNGRSYEFEYKYADIADVLAAVRPVLSKHKLAVMQPTYMVRNDLVVATRLMHASGQWMESEYPVSAIVAKHQAMGGALTYARRYSLCSMLGIAAEEDTDGAHAALPESRHQRQETRQERRAQRQQQTFQQPEDRQEQPLSPAEAMINEVKKRTTPTALQRLEQSPTFKADYASLVGPDKTWVDTVLQTQREAVADPTAHVGDATPPHSPLPQKPREEAPPHEPGRLSQRALGAAQYRQPSRQPPVPNGQSLGSLEHTLGVKQGAVLDDEIPF
jgi:hypothetical protein